MSRSVSRVFRSRPTLEGAGVRLRRVFGGAEVPALDPFLLLDDFRSSRPDDYLAGFPWHPHRGIETITYVLAGDVEHGDSLGNKGVIGAGDVQWMTAGSGIIHQEMPKGDSAGKMEGFQLWTNLPAAEKMMDPRYREVTSGQIPVAELDDGVRVRVVCGEAYGVQGPVREVVAAPEYFDMAIPAGVTWVHPTPVGHAVFAYVFEGDGSFGQKGTVVSNGTGVLLSDGDSVAVTAGVDGVRFLLLTGKPLREPVAWAGPIVMNTQDELDRAFEEYRSGAFVKNGARA